MQFCVKAIISLHLLFFLLKFCSFITQINTKLIPNDTPLHIQSIANCWTNFLSFMLEHFTLSSHSLSDVMRKIFYLCANSYILDSYVKVMFVLSHGIKATKFTKKANNGELILKKGMTQKKKNFL